MCDSQIESEEVGEDSDVEEEEKDIENQQTPCTNAVDAFDGSTIESSKGKESSLAY